MFRRHHCAVIKKTNRQRRKSKSLVIESNLSLWLTDPALKDQQYLLTWYSYIDRKSTLEFSRSQYSIQSQVKSLTHSSNAKWFVVSHLSLSYSDIDEKICSEIGLV